ncbi:MAG TPA: helix-turn-helix domain-containing protein [Vulgatibacter sp.]
MRALLREDRADDELAQALAAAGLYVERIPAGEGVYGRLRDRLADVAVIDPRLLPQNAPERRPRDEKARERAAAEAPSVESSPLEELCYRRLAAVLDRLDGATLPELYATAMAQSERALLRLALDRTTSISAGAELLGIHRNTLVRRLEELGLRQRDDARAEDGAGARRGRRRGDPQKTGERKAAHPNGSRRRRAD